MELNFEGLEMHKWNIPRDKFWRVDEKNRVPSPIYNRNVHQKCSNVKKLSKQARGFENTVMYNCKMKKNNFEGIYLNKQI